MRQWFLGTDQRPQFVKSTRCIVVVSCIASACVGCRDRSHGGSGPDLHAPAISDAAPRQAISQVEEHITGQLALVNLNAEGHEASAANLRQFVLTLESVDIQACPSDFQMQFAANLNAWRKVLNDAELENTYLRHNPTEDPDKGGLPSMKDRSLAMRVNSSLREALIANQRLRVVAARYGVKWR